MVAVLPALMLVSVSCATAIETKTPVVETAALPDLDEVIERLRDRRVIYVGESHDRYEDHLNQLRVLEGLHAQGQDLAIGMEFFQQPFQPFLDAYVAGDISEEEMLRQTEYFTRWRFDYRLYRPILRFARKYRVPLIALNLESELIEKVGELGIDGLSPAERARLPADIDRDDPEYRARLRKAFEAHPMLERSTFEHFLDVQLVWDEGMAERAARYLKAHPSKTLVVLAGAGHLEYGQGIPRRLQQRMPVSSAILLNGRGRVPATDVADFLLYPQPADLPPGGLLGVQIDNEAEGGGVLVIGFAETSGAKEAGIEKQDRIVRIGATAVTEYSDVRIALIDQSPGVRIPVQVVRDRLLGQSERLTFEVELH